jgi:hypothetical protein
MGKKAMRTKRVTGRRKATRRNETTKKKCGDQD